MFNVGIVGFGTQGQKYAALIHKMDGVEVSCIYDVDLHKLEVPYSACVGPDHDEAWGEEDLLIIATPNHLHAQQSVKALEKGCTVLCEKPIALKWSDARRVLEAQGKGVIYPVAQNRLAPSSQWLKRVVPMLGQIYEVRVTLVWNRNQAYYDAAPWRADKEKSGGALFLQFSHYIDLLTWLFGEKLAVLNARELNYRRGDAFKTGEARFYLTDGNSLVGVNMYYTVEGFERNAESSVLVVAEKGTVKLGGQYMERLEYIIMDEEVEYDLEPIKSNEYKGYQGSANMLEPLLRNVIGAVRGENEPYATYASVLPSIELMEGIKEAAK